MTRKLKTYPIHETDPRCCATCRFHEFALDGYWLCLRNETVGGDTGDREDIQTVCAGWVSRIKRGQYVPPGELGD